MVLFSTEETLTDKSWIIRINSEGMLLGHGTSEDGVANQKQSADTQKKIPRQL